MTTVTKRANESQEQMFRRFRKKVMKAGTLRDVRRKRWFVPKGEERREARKKAARRLRRRHRTAAR